MTCLQVDAADAVSLGSSGSSESWSLFHAGEFEQIMAPPGLQGLAALRGLPSQGPTPDAGATGQESEPAAPVTGAMGEMLSFLGNVGVLDLLPQTQDGAPSSLGSMGHDQEECHPCKYHVRGRCRMGLLCLECHMPHTRQQVERIRPPKRVRASRHIGEQVFMRASLPHTCCAHPGSFVAVPLVDDWIIQL
mmetsp:Transcript_26194/g.59644  ORF Transcript_26194/g.59644 Transcript_26194/m.59644 type:complete len:191 (+) Transcript_26194:31-603(+)